jgi:hypothetical protein
LAIHPTRFFYDLLAGKSGVAFLAEPFPYDTVARLASAVTL